MSEDSASASGDSVEMSPDVLHDASNDPYSNGPLSFQHGFSRGGNQPYVELQEMPQQRGFRFRYRCEGPSHGGLQGERSERGNKTYPTIKICNYSGRARVLVLLVTDEKVPRTHAHELMGKHCKHGICMVDVQECNGNDSIISFPNLGILHVTKKKVESILVERLTELERVHQQLMTGSTMEPSEKRAKEIARQAKDEAKKMQLNVVKLKFVVYLPNGPNFSHVLEPVYTNPIYDSKCPGVAGLNICRMDRNAGCCTGNEEVFLLCDKVQKDDILVRFFEEDEDRQLKWESFGNFGPSDVHRQYAIVFKTPPYLTTAITHPIQVNVQLKRISDLETSEPKPFTYYPQQQDKNEVGKKRKKALPWPSNRNIYSSNFRGLNNFGPNTNSGAQARTTNLSGGGNQINGNSNSCNFHSSFGLGLQAAGPLPGNPSNDPAASASGFSVNLTNPQMNFSHMNLGLLDGHLQNTGQLLLPAANNQIPQPLSRGGGQVLSNKVSQMSDTPISISTGGFTEGMAIEEIETILSQTGVDLPQTQAGPLDMPHNTITSSPQDHILPQTTLSQQMFAQQPQQQKPQPHHPSQVQQQFLDSALQGYGHLQYGDTPQQSQTSHVQYPQQPYSPGQAQPYSPGQAQYSPASQQTYSPQGAQHCYSPGVPAVQQSYSPGAQHQYSPESAQQFSPPQPMLRHSPPIQSHLYQARDLVMDGGGVDNDDLVPIMPQKLGTDVEMDSGEYLDDLQEDAVPIAPEEAEALAEDFHKRHTTSQSSIEADKELIGDIEKLTLTENTKKVVDIAPKSEEAKSMKGKTQEPVESCDDAEEELLESVSKSGLVLALNVARRTVVALHNYAQTGDPIYMILCQRHLVSVQDDLGDTALHMSIIHGRNDVTLQLLRAVSTLRHCSSDIVNIVNILNQTPLHLAVLTNQASLISSLLGLGASRLLVDKQGDSPLHLAAKMGNSECLHQLLQRVPYHGQEETDEEIIASTEKLNFDGFSPLHLAVMHQRAKCVQILFKAGVDVNHCDGRSGRTALHHATETNNLSIARLILSKSDVDVDVQAYDGSTALHIGAGRKLYDIVRLLVHHNADPYRECCERVDEEEEEEDLCIDSPDSCHDYIKPVDLADGDQLMLDILLKKDDDNSILQTQRETDGDVNKLDQTTRSALSDKLDPLLAGGDWQALARGLNLTSAMDGFRLQPSPTLHLLDKYEMGKGTLGQLCKVLSDMHRYDAVALVDSVIGRCTKDNLPEIRKELQHLSKRPLSDDQRSFDSGLGSVSLTLNSIS